MITFDAIIKKFAKQGEKTGWTYIDVPTALANKLLPGNKKGFRVKGMADAYHFEGISLLPMGGGDFIMTLNAPARKEIRKPVGAVIKIQLQVDNKPEQLCKEMLECLADEPEALVNFQKLPPSHQRYYSKWIEGAKTEVTKAKRIAHTITACSQGLHYGQMMQSLKNNH